MENYDIIVAGAGPSGICAAIQTARLGAKTLLVEKNGIPGGAITSAGISEPGLFDAFGEQLISGIGWELVAETLRIEGRELPDFSRQMVEALWKYQVKINPCIFACVAEKAMLDSGVSISYHTMVGKAVEKNDSWELTLCGKDGLFEVSGEMLIDCTGDANLTKLAGYEVVAGDVCQPGSANVVLTGIDESRIDHEAMAAAFAEAEKTSAIHYKDLGWFRSAAEQGKFLFLDRHGVNGNHIGFINAADSEKKSAMECAAHASILRAYKFLKQQKGLENLSISSFSPECGVRETRRILGEYTMTKDDYLGGRSFADALCYSFYYVDIHDMEKGLILEQITPGTRPQMSRRIMIPKGAKRLMAAGRIVSSDRAANSCLRIQASCMASGQAAGANVFCALQTGTAVGDAPLEMVKKVLRDHGAIVPETES